MSKKTQTAEMPKTTYDRIADMCDRLKETLQSKNADYGDSAFKPPLLRPNMDAGCAILVRMSDKINRIITLEQYHRVAERVDFDMMKQTESLADTYLDLAGYALLRLIELEKER